MFQFAGCIALVAACDFEDFWTDDTMTIIHEHESCCSRG